MNELTKKQKEIIAANYRVYIANFGYLHIKRENGGFYVYTSENSDRFTCFCSNIDYLNGWLYGAVQAANGVMEKN